MDLTNFLYRASLKLVLVALASCYAFNSVANFIVNFSPSVGFAPKPNSKTVLLVDNPQNLSNKYAPYNYWTVTPVIDLFIGKEISQSDKLKLISGIKAGYVHALDMSGKVYQFALPGFDNFRYQYKLRSAALSISSKLIFTQNKTWAPYAVINLGGAFNKAYGYSEQPLINGAVPMNSFKSNSELAFTYGFGFGFQLNSNEKFSVGLGYEYSDLGTSRLGLSSSQTTQNHLALSHLTLHKLVANLIWDI